MCEARHNTAHVDSDVKYFVANHFSNVIVYNVVSQQHAVQFRITIRGIVHYRGIYKQLGVTP